MKGFPPLKGVKLNKETISKIKSYFKYTMFFEGVAIASISKSGGIHYTGVRTKEPGIAFEVIRGGIYIMVVLFEYPHGLVFHSHIYLPDIDKVSGMDPRVVKLYSEVKNLLEVKE
jgi:hypothetical protein